jgi:signal transduction histidine kinase
MIEAVRVDGKEFSPADLPAIQSRNRDLEIDFTSTEFSSPQRVQFRYQLEGAEPTWHDVGTRRRAYFTNLTPGTYHFRVASGNGDGVWNQQSAVWSFRVLPAWYQTLSFRGAAILLIGGLFAAIAVLFQRRRHVAAQAALRVQYEAALGERARIAQDLHDTLLQGFIGVTLQLKAAENALPAKPLVAAQTLARVQQLARDSLREARERVWDMRDSELGSTDIAAALESLANERTVDTGIDVLLIIGGARRRLPRQVENAAFRIGREVIANAVRHAAPHRIEIEAMFGETVFALEVRDDGRGFTPEQAEDARHQGHFGLTGVRERATRMGGTCDVRAREGGGTVVALKLPIEQREQAAQ